MSQAARDAFLLSLTDADSADHVTRRWLEGPRVTADNLKRGTGPIERCTSEQWFGAKGKTAGAPAVKPANGVMWFGKHRGRPMVDVQSEDPGYWSWCCREVRSFEAKARKAGLLDEDAVMDGEHDDPSDEGDGDAMTVNR